ncbi:uncharacterized protein mlip isoform X3 [Nelusetta ayraudi]
MTEERRSGTQIGHSNKNEAASREGTTGETMSAGDTFRVEKVFIKDSAEGAAGDTMEARGKNHLHLESRLPAKASPPAGVRPASPPLCVPAGKTASAGAAGGQHGGAGLCKVSSGRRASEEDRSSPADSADLWPPLASSRESILSEGWDVKDGGWSAAGASSLSRTVSPCSSVLSGVFSPAVVRVKRHFLEPGSSLIHTPCFSSCESLASPSSSSATACPQSPPPPQPPHRRRPPLTRLSLLTAILRKGRLPVLSSALQRPYTPCWPMSPVTLSFCNACSAASSVASIPLELSSRFPSTVSVDSQSHSHREPDGCAGATPAEAPVKRCSEQVRSSGTAFPPWQRALSPPPPPPSTSRFTCASPPPKRDLAASANLSYAPHAPKPSDTYAWPRGRPDNEDGTLVSRTSQRTTEHGMSPRGSRPASSTLSRLHQLSLQLRTPPRSPPPLQPAHPSAREETGSPLPHPQVVAGRYRPEPSRPGADSPVVSQGLHRARQFSPARYASPVSSPGWLSPTSASPTPTPSPLPPYRHASSCPSPLSMRSTPSPRPGSGISDYSDGEGKKRKTHKIKSSYKSLAAIPTNTLLLDQQAIDEQVERGLSDAAARGAADTHAEMCSPAELRQQSEELYAVIDDVLASSTPTTSRSQQSSRTSTPTVGLQQNNVSCLKSLGRETKYASCSSLQPSTRVERGLLGPKKTKPGVIRPMTAIPTLRVEDEDEYYRNPFRLCDKETFRGGKKVDSDGALHYQRLREEWKADRSPHSVFDLQITEPSDRRSPVSTSFSPP